MSHYKLDTKFHSGLPVFSGGYVGVDVFFVISGFLITRLIYSQMLNDSFSFKEFYLRRIRRLFPAFIVVLFTTIAFAYFFMLPEELEYHSKLAGLSFLSLGNFYIANTTGNYFASAVEEVALVHTWSLAVEEQFYIIWPAMLILLLKWFNKVQLVFLLFSVFISSFIFSVYVTEYFPVEAYFLLPSRFHELLMGCMLAIFFDEIKKPNDLVANILGIVGFIIIIISSLLFEKNTFFPGYNAFWPCFGAVLLIYSGIKETYIRRILSSKFLVKLGLLSYSLYLWHWIVFVVYRYFLGEISTQHIPLVILISLIISWFSWRFIEQPFRNKWKWKFNKTIIVLGVIPLFILLGCIYWIDKNEGIPERFGNHAFEDLYKNQKITVSRRSCNNESMSTCSDVLLIGDSHAEHFTGFLNKLTEDASLSFSTATKAACPPFYEVVINRNVGDGFEFDSYGCYDYTKKLIDTIKGHKYVVISAYWYFAEKEKGSYFLATKTSTGMEIENSYRLLEEGLNTTVKKVLESGALPIILLDNIVIPDQVFRCLKRKVLFETTKDCSVSSELLATQKGSTESIFKRLKVKYPSLQFIDPNLVLCTTQKCITQIENIPLYLDDNHFYQKASEKIGELYLKKHINILSDF